MGNMRGHQEEAVELTAIASEGETQAEALSNLAEATSLYLEEFPLPLGERPVVTTFRIADVA